MKTLKIDTRDANSDELFRQLSLGGGLVCPNLKHLYWASPCGWVHAQQFSSPGLATVCFPYWRNALASSCLELASTINLLPTTHLESFTLGQVFEEDFIIGCALSGLVQRLKTCFTDLSISSPLTDPAWENLASLPRLNFLSVSGTPSANVRRPSELSFPAVKGLEIWADPPCLCWLALFFLLESSPLEEVRVRCRRTHPDDVLSQVISAMLKVGLEGRVNSLSFRGFGLGSLAFVQQLLLFCSLKTLYWLTVCLLGRPCISPLTDSGIGELAEALNKLEFLSFQTRCKHSSHHITIKSMISFSTHCPHLKTLILPCDLANILEDIKTVSEESRPRLEKQSSSILKHLPCITLPPEGTEALNVAVSALRNLFPHWEQLKGRSLFCYSSYGHLLKIRFQQ